ncbi:GDSL-type esterase/lipase family protein [Pseudomonas typographi]|uniref:GDSL-type esterase/lipase family protein n=1 Tax=Pseudomonas typographi TaxID=2715964 RepID=UPI001686270F|nr:GDSL-type esterase/lipase family protein [Pseudomonas typographi]MBD1554109.1 SGNH/GDSL hydrolase family protein [Pseudomonas typographi]MBD1588558.1 SGNH/GDSL hydrolase family protein [Pseudomonas typographi]
MQSLNDPLVAYPYVVPRLDGVTLRQLVKLRSSGSALRVWLSNEYGLRPIHIGAAYMAPAGADGGHAGPGRAITFAGSAGIVIAAGTQWVSDPIELSSDADSTWLVSLYIERADEAARTLHRQGSETAWLSAPGNFVAHQAFEPEQILDCRYILSGVDVLDSTTPSVLVAIGDSLTDGDGSTPDSYGRWTDQAATRLRALSPASLCVVNQGISGGRLLYGGYGDALLARFDRDVLAVSGVTAVFVLCGLNDLYMPGVLRAPGEQIDAKILCAALAQVRDRARGRGLKVYAGTLTPTGGTTGLFDYFSATGESHRQAVNHWLRNTAGFDGVADFDAALSDPRDPTRLAARFDCGDHLHLNNSGYRAMADTVVAMLQR